jgi:hypothetical protein
MNRAHVRVQHVPLPPPLSPGHQYYLEEAPPAGAYPNAHANSTFMTIDPHDKPFNDFRTLTSRVNLVSDAGSHLTAELRSNAEVKKALDHARSPGTCAGNIPIFIEACSDWSERFPWEVVIDAAGDFLACRAETQVGRLVHRGPAANRMLDGTQLNRRPVLRVLAALVSGIAAADQEEWNRLNQARNDVNATGSFEMDLDVLVCDAALEQKIAKVLQRPCQVALLTAKADVYDALKRKPHILHFFCHGQTQPVHYLAMATNGSVQGACKPLSMSAADLANEVGKKAPHHVWMAILNCCDGAAPGSNVAGSQSIARELVGEHIPVVLGMSEPIDRNSAHVFTESFYRELKDQIVSRFPASGSATSEVEWVDALHAPRRDLLGDRTNQLITTTLAGQYKIWANPVLYTIPRGFRFGYTVRGGPNPTAVATDSVVSAQISGIRGVPVDVAAALA